MRTAPVTIAGLAGPVVVEHNSFTGKSTVQVGSSWAEAQGRGWFLLPTAAGGTVRGRVRKPLVDPYPSVEIDGFKHRTGPESPVLLKVLTLLPLALMIGGLFGALLGVLGITANLAIARGPQSTGAKAALMLLVGGAVLGAFMAVAVAINS